MSDTQLKDRSSDTRTGGPVRFYGVHHLALNTDDMKMTVDFYAGVLGMRLVHAMKVPPGLGTGPGNRGNPPFEEVRHYFFDMGRDGLLAFFEMPKGAKQRGDRNALGAMQHVSFAFYPDARGQRCSPRHCRNRPGPQWGDFPCGSEGLWARGSWRRDSGGGWTRHCVVAAADRDSVAGRDPRRHGDHSAGGGGSARCPRTRTARSGVSEQSPRGVQRLSRQRPAVARWHDHRCVATTRFATVQRAYRSTSWLGLPRQWCGPALRASRSLRWRHSGGDSASGRGGSRAKQSEPIERHGHRRAGVGHHREPQRRGAEHRGDQERELGRERERDVLPNHAQRALGVTDQERNVFIVIARQHDIDRFEAACRAESGTAR